MRTAIVIYALMGFVWLSYASLHRIPVHSYAMVHSTLTFRQKQAKALEELWHISDKEINEPIDLFGEHRQR